MSGINMKTNPGMIVALAIGISTFCLLGLVFWIYILDEDEVLLRGLNLDVFLDKIINPIDHRVLNSIYFVWNYILIRLYPCTTCTNMFLKTFA